MSNKPLREKRINIPQARSIIDPIRQITPYAEGDSQVESKNKEGVNRVEQIKNFNKNKYKRQSTTTITKMIRRK